MSKETGGFAFPSKVSNLSNEKQNIYGYDVPPGDSFIAGGMNLRDYFAAKAMQGILANPGQLDNVNDDAAKWVARDAYKVADAMLKARNAT